ncbi:MAG: hypothetical protein LBT47_02535 [Deltaproteobacteria bacterium]|jgi:hypothetical protein|nr:hypothetical protein [Deltaproteobacteria bacterium]
MTITLHHVNQLFLHLPAMGGLVAGQVAASEEIQRQARLAEAQAIYRDTVELVAAAKESVAAEYVHPEPERPKGRRRRRVKSRGRSQPDSEFAVEQVIDLRV